MIKLVLDCAVYIYLCVRLYCVCIASVYVCAAKETVAKHTSTYTRELPNQLRVQTDTPHILYLFDGKQELVSYSTHTHDAQGKQAGRHAACCTLQHTQ